ncbi:MAG: glutamate synthase [Ruminococcus sp.]|nr:glutamate synthase [Ruminococcus sp.]
MLIDVSGLGFSEINSLIRTQGESCHLTGCLSQRFIGAGMSYREITIDGTPGNALGAYLNGGEITVNGNAQDAVGDTMNDGKIIIHGHVGDAVGYAMRGGEIYVRDSAGYRAGIHMKQYKEKRPIMVIGGRAGSFLGEYQAGGLIIVLGLNKGDYPIVGNFPGTGMHGGKLFLRTAEGLKFPAQVNVNEASDEDMAEIMPYLKNYCTYFGADLMEILNSKFTVVTPNSKNPYRQMYVNN